MSLHRPRSQRAFTLIELLMVVTIIAVLAGLILPAVAGMRAKSQSVQCLSNMRHFGVAFTLYAGEFGDYMPPNRMGEFVPKGQTWVNGWVTGRSPDATNRVLLRESLLSTYISGDSAWHCPGDNSQVFLDGSYYDRIRSLSMNYYMGAAINLPSRQTYRKMGDLVQLSPSDAFVFTDERSETINDGSFIIDANFNARDPNSWRLIDLPGNFHGRGTGMAFADNHAEMHLWQDPRTIAASYPFQTLGSNPDLLWLDSHSSAPTVTH